MHADTLAAGNWWARPRQDAESWIATYRKSLNHRHRTALVEILRTIQPVSLLEVGCHCGPNLVRFAGEFPKLEMLGVDINQDAIRAGTEWMKRSNLSHRVQLNAGRVPTITSGIPTGACEVVLSCYALAYIAPADLDAVLYEMGRIASKAVILAEPMVSEGSAPAIRALTGYNEWAHNYGTAAKWIGTWHGLTQRTVPIEPPIDRLNGILVATRDGS